MKTQINRRRPQCKLRRVRRLNFIVNHQPRVKHFYTFLAKAMSKGIIRMFSDVKFDLLPVPGIIENLFARGFIGYRAGREQFS